MSTALIPAPEELKRRIYLIGLPISAAASLLIWFLERDQGVLHAVDRFGLPALAALLALLTIAFQRRKSDYRALELTLFGAFALFMILNLAYTLFNPGTPGLAAIGYWFPVLYALAYLLFGTRLGQRLAVGTFAAALLVGLLHTVFADPQVVRAEMLVLTQIFLANGLLLFLLGGYTLVTHHQQLQADASDPVTRFVSRHEVARILESEVTRAFRYGKQLSVIRFDLDGFSDIGDAHGPDASDRVLAALGNLMRHHLRSADMLGRWGPQSFLLVVPEGGLETAQQLAERLRTLIEAHDFPHVGKMTASFGVSSYALGDAAKALVAGAERAVIRAKQAGANLVKSA